MKTFLVSYAVLMAACLFVGCSSPTSSSGSSGSSGSTSTTTSTVYSVTGTASSNVNVKFAFSKATAAPSSATVAGAKLIFAADNTYVSSTPGNPGWFADSAWVVNFATTPSASSTWVTETATATLGATTDVDLSFWMNSGHLYFKELDLTYSDSSTEKLTFTTATSNPVHSVYTPVSGSSTTTDEAFSWTYVSTLTGESDGVTTVSF